MIDFDQVDGKVVNVDGVSGYVVVLVVVVVVVVCMHLHARDGSHAIAGVSSWMVGCGSAKHSSANSC